LFFFIFLLQEIVKMVMNRPIKQAKCQRWAKLRRGVKWSRGPVQSEAKGTLVDLAHEALVRYDRNKKPYWKRFRTWVDKCRKRLEDRDLLEALAQAWADKGKPGLSGLASGRQLRDFRRSGTHTELPADYVEAATRLQWLRGFLAGIFASV
jgi:hypothetical protein